MMRHKSATLPLRTTAELKDLLRQAACARESRAGDQPDQVPRGRKGGAPSSRKFAA